MSGLGFGEVCREDGIRGRRTGIHAAVAIHDTINTVVGTSPRNGLINDASCCITLVCLLWFYLYFFLKCIHTAAPNGFAKLANAVAPTLPPSVNHISLYRVGAASTKGCASPVNI